MSIYPVAGAQTPCWRMVSSLSHPWVAECLHDLAELLRGLGRYGEAEPLYRRALEIPSDKLGERHPDVAETLDHHAALLTASGRKEANELSARADTIRASLARYELS